MGETLVEALKREIKEEVGLEIFDIRPLMSQEVIFSPQFHKRRHFIFFDFACKCRDEEVRVDGVEITGYQWFWPKEALELDLDEFTRRMVEKYPAPIMGG